MTDLVAQLVGALQDCLDDSHQVLAQMEQMYGTNYRQDLLEAQRKTIADAEAALSAAKDGGWLPIEKASDSDKRRCWVLVGESVHLAAYIVIGFEEKRDLDGRYIDQVDHDEYWMDLDSGDPLEPSHFQPLTQPLTNPPKEQNT